MKYLSPIMLFCFAAPLAVQAETKSVSSTTAQQTPSVKQQILAALQADDLQAVQALYSDASVLCKSSFRTGKPAERVLLGTLMREAARHDAIKVAAWLIQEKKANPHDVLWDNYGSPLSTAQSHLHVAAEHGSLKVAELLLARNVNVNLVDRKGHTALMYAAASSSPQAADMVDLLLTHGANASFRSYTGEAAIDMVPESQERVFSHLCYFGVLPKDRARYDAWVQKQSLSFNAVGPTVDLWQAVHQDDLVAAEQALKAGANPQVESAYGVRNMLVAINHGNAAMVRLLLRYGDTVNLNRNDYFTNLYAAVLCGNPDVLDLIPYEEPKEDEERESPFLVALRGNCGAVMAAALLEAGANPEARSLLSAYALSAFNIANIHTKDEQVTTLLRYQSDDTWSLSGDVFTPVRKPEEISALLSTPGIYAVDKRGTWDVTPLALARKEGEEAVARLLLAAGADSAPIKKQSCATHPKFFFRNPELQQGVQQALAENDTNYFLALHPHLVNANAGPVDSAANAYNSAPHKGIYYEGTPLKHAAAAGKTDIVRVLLARDAFMEHADIYGRTAIEYAAANGHVECVQLLLNAGAKRYNQALQVAALCGQHAVVDYLLKRGVRPGLAVEYALMSNTPHSGLLAARAGDPDIALGLAVQLNHPQAVKRLIALGANVNRPHFYPLHTSTKVEVLEALVEAGADIHRRNAEGLTPLEFHIKNACHAAAAYLESVEPSSGK